VTTLIATAAPVTTFLLLVAVGLELTVDDLARVRRQRLVVATGLLAPLVLLPVLAVGLTRLFEVPPDIASGVMLLAACPIGSVANAFTALARGSTALSVTLTGLSCVGASITIPAVGRAVEAMSGDSFALRAPMPLLVVQLLLVLALPVALGMWGRRHSPARAVRLSPFLQRLAVRGIILVLLLIVLEDWRAVAANLSTMVPLSGAFVGASAALGWIVAMPITADPRDRFAVASGFGARNVAIATAIAVTLLDRIEFARFAVIYSLTEVPIMLLAAAWFRASYPTGAPILSERLSDRSEPGPVAPPEA
jgi:BASS family bile acid:Na+ symporter